MMENLEKSQQPLVNPCYPNRPLTKHRHLNHSVMFKIMPLDLFPQTDIFTILSHRIFTFKPRKAIIYWVYTHPVLNPSYQYYHLNVAR